jgi:predicted deacylase
MTRLTTFENITPERGKLKYGYVRGVELGDGTPVNIPLLVASGDNEGPILSITAGIHGTELIGVEIIRRILRERIDLRELNGTIVCIPVANPLSIQQCTYVTSYDGLDIMGAFPGDPEGTITRRLAAKIWDIIKRSEYALDIHAIEDPAIPFVIVWPSKNKAREKAFEMAKASALTLTEPGRETLSRRVTTQVGLLMDMGIPSVVLEIPFGRVWEERMVETGVLAVLNVLRYLEMLPGKVEKQDGIIALDGVFSTQMIKAERGGFMIPLKSVGQKISKGEVLGRIVNAFGEEVQEITAPYESYLFSYPLADQRNASHAVASGDMVCFIGQRL